MKKPPGGEPGGLSFSALSARFPVAIAIYAVIACLRRVPLFQMQMQ
jgi:hypothetical protein